MDIDEVQTCMLGIYIESVFTLSACVVESLKDSTQGLRRFATQLRARSILRGL